MKPLPVNLLIFLLITYSNLIEPLSKKDDYRLLPIGLFYYNTSELTKVEEIAQKLNSQTSTSKFKYKFEIKGLQLNRNDNMITLSTSVCKHFININPIYAAIIGDTSFLIKNNDYLLTTTAISFSCGYYQLPIFGLHLRDAIFSDKVF